MQIPGLIDFSSGSEAQAKVEGAIASKTQQFAQQQFIDPAMEKRGQAAAEQQGAAFQELPGFTEAQKAYNKAGEPIAASMLTTSLQTQANQYFLEAKQNGFPSDAAATFQGKMQAFSDQTRNTQSPQLHAITIESTNKLSSLYSRLIQSAQFKQQREQSAINLSNHYAQSLSNVISMAHEHGSSNPENYTPSILAAQQINAAGVKQGTTTPTQYMRINTNYQKKLQLAQAQGDLNNMAQALNNPNLSQLERQNITEMIRNYPNTILANVAFKGPNTELLQRRATTRANEILNGVHVDRAASQQEANNQIAMHRNGAPIDEVSWGQNQNKLKPSAQASNESRMNAAGYLRDTDIHAGSLTIAENKGLSTAPMPFHNDVMASDRGKLAHQEQQEYKKYANLLSHDPQTVNVNNQGLQSSQQQIITTLKPSDQKMVHLGVANPGLALSGPLSSASIMALNKIWSRRTALSRGQGGPGYFLTNASAATMWAGISNLSPADQSKTIVGWQQKLSPQNYHTLQQQIERTSHVGAGAFISAYASTGNNVAVVNQLNDALTGDQRIIKEGKESETLNESLSGLKRSKVVTEMESGNMSSLSPVLTSIRGPLLASGRTDEYLGIRHLASTIYLSRKAKGDSDLVAQQAAVSFIQSNWKIDKSRQGVIIPTHYTDDAGNPQQTNYDNVNGIMQDVLNHPSRYVKVSQNKNANFVQNESAKRNYYAGLKWKNNSSGGFMLVDADNNIVLSKSGGALGFTVRNADERMAMINAYKAEHKKGG